MPKGFVVENQFASLLSDALFSCSLLSLSRIFHANKAAKYLLETISHKSFDVVISWCYRNYMLARALLHRHYLCLFRHNTNVLDISYALLQ